MCKVSVIVPSKNMEQFIDQCMDSLVSQTLRDIEIIVVDAFSVDKTREKVRGYQKKDSRILLLDDTVGSSGYADNLGFKVAKGDYLAIVEADDYIRPSMLECLYNKATANDLDYIKADFSMFIEIDGYNMTLDRCQPLRKLDIYDKVIIPSDYPELLELDGYMWKGLYKKSFIRMNQIKLNESKGAAYQDNGFLHQTICLAKRVMYIDESFYQYRRDNENSSDYNPKGLQMMLEEYRYVDSFMKRKKEEVQFFYPYYYFKMFHQFRGQFEKVVRFSSYSPEISFIIQGYKELFKEGLEDKHLRQDEFGNELEELYFLLEDEKEYFEYLKRKFTLRDKIYSDFIKNMKKIPQIVLVCCGQKGRDLYALLRKNGCNNFAAVCDNSKEKWGMAFFDRIILSVEEASNRFDNAYFLIANDLYHDHIKRQLLDYGIQNVQIGIFNIVIWPHLSTSQIVQV